MLLLSGEKKLYRQLYDALREQIITGERAAGSKLPSKRSMAAQLGISVNTVDAAYAQLVSEGYATVFARSGFRVCAIDSVQTVSMQNTAFPEKKEEPRSFAVDFDPAKTAENLFPRSVWQRLSTQVSGSVEWLHRSQPQGDAGLREAIAAYLYEARGVHTSKEQILVGSGTQSLLTVLALLLDNDDTFAVENPVYHRCAEIFQRIGHPIVPVEVDRQGVCCTQLQRLDRAVLYTTPSHQFPLGICMPIERRVKLLNWCAEKENRYLIEDDYDSEFRYDARPVPPMFVSDKNERVIYLGTFSSTVSPALRVGYMVLPDSLLHRYRSSALPLSCNVPMTEQLVLRRFLLEGFFEKHLNRMRTYYKKQRRCLLEQLKCFGDMIEPIGEAAGSHLTVRVKNGMREQELVETAARVGVKVYPISPYFLGQMPKKYAGKLLLGFGGLSEQEIAEGVRRLYTAWK